jgi:hypothetical protein
MEMGSNVERFGERLWKICFASKLQRFQATRTGRRNHNISLALKHAIHVSSLKKYLIQCQHINLHSTFAPQSFHFPLPYQG